ncbi:MAG: hypothetical protein JXI33_06845 [Candidatus Aminicenantes bacterium]|nr:hypothetical protein [Candidatus Aminicenantes bacterium]
MGNRSSAFYLSVVLGMIDKNLIDIAAPSTALAVNLTLNESVLHRS